MARRDGPPEVERKIYFYKMEVYDDTGDELDVEVTDLLRPIHALPFTESGRYLEDLAGNVTCCWIDRGRPRRLRLANVRRSGLPRVESGGRVRSLRIPAESGLVEEIHVVFFADGIVGSEFNFYGPRLSRLGRYFEAKCSEVCSHVRFVPLLRQNVVQELMNLSDIRLLQLRVRAPYTAIITEADRDLGAAFEAARRATDGEEIEVIVRPRARSRGGRLAERLLPVVRAIAGRNDLQESASRFMVRGFDRDSGEVETVDVLNDYLIARKGIVLEDARTRALNTESAYRAIEDAYRELRGELRDAAGLPPGR